MTGSRGRTKIEMKRPLPEFKDESLTSEVKAIIEAIASIGSKAVVIVEPKDRYGFGCLDIVLALTLLAIVIGASSCGA